MPLAWGILEGPQRALFEAILSTPAECADHLAAKRVDVGLIPSIEYQRIKGTRIILGPVVASTHRVRSVLLLSVKPLWAVRTVGADDGSRTSVTLARIIFEKFYNLRPEFRPVAPDLGRMLAENDAALLIGDPALKFMEKNLVPNVENQKPLLREGGPPLQVFDLVERWKVLTGLPFVFAFWAVREGFTDRTLTEAFVQSRDYGIANLTPIVERFSAELSLKPEFVRQYLEKNVSYHLDREGLQALRLFYDYAKDIGAIKSVRDLEFL